MKVFVTGALGFIGRALLDRYRAAGAEVAGVGRRAAPELGVAAGDVVDPEPWSELMRGADVVFHSAAIVSNTASDEAIRRVNVLGTRRVVEAAAAAAGQVITIGDGVGLPTMRFFDHYARMLGGAPLPPLAIAAAGTLGGILRCRGRETEIGAETMADAGPQRQLLDREGADVARLRAADRPRAEHDPNRALARLRGSARRQAITGGERWLMRSDGRRP